VAAAALVALANFFPGWNYPVMLFGYTHTYGALGLSYMLLTVALAAVGSRAAGPFMLGLAPAVHPSLGVWTVVILSAATLLEHRRSLSGLRRPALFFAVGGVVSAASLGLALLAARDVPEISPAIRLQYIAVFAKHWDVHRDTGIPLVPLGLVCLTAAFSALGLRAPRSAFPREARVLLWFVLIAAAAGVALAIVWRFAPVGWLPTWFVIAMPTRPLNLNIVAMAALVAGAAGVAWSGSRDPMLGVLLALMVYAPALCGHKGLASFVQGEMPFLAGPRAMLVAATVVALAAAAKERSLPKLGLWFLVGLGMSALCRRPAFRDPLLFALIPATLLTLRAGGARISAAASATVAVLLAAAGAAVYLFSPHRYFLIGALVVKTGLGAAWLAAWGAAFLSCVLLGAMAKRTTATAPRWLGALASLFSPRQATRGLLTVAMAAGWPVLLLRGAEAFPGRVLEDRTNNPFHEAIARNHGYLLTASNLHLWQAPTRRPILLDGGALDAIPYAPESGPETNRLLRQFYGIDLFRPFDLKHRWAALPPDAGKELWETRSPAEWANLCRAWGVTNVLTHGDWRLQLPTAAQTSKFILYNVSP
jgi:hypothetical protein